jgi:hypothetical protein
MLYPFGGLGGGAVGQARCNVRLLGHHGRIESMGGIDFEQLACLDFRDARQRPRLGHESQLPPRRPGCPPPLRADGRGRIAGSRALNASDGAVGALGLAVTTSTGPTSTPGAAVTVTLPLSTGLPSTVNR